MPEEKVRIHTIKTAAKYLELTRGAIHTAIRTGKLKATRAKGYQNMAGGHEVKYFINQNDLDAYVKSKHNHQLRVKNGELLFDPDKGIYSTDGAASFLSKELGIDYPRNRVYYLIRRGLLRVKKYGASFLLQKEDLLAVAERERAVGHIIKHDAHVDQSKTA